MLLCLNNSLVLFVAQISSTRSVSSPTVAENSRASSRITPILSASVYNRVSDASFSAVPGVNPSIVNPSIPLNPSKTTYPPFASSTNLPVLIQGLNLNHIPTQTFGESFIVAWTLTAGSDVMVDISYNGFLCCSAGPSTRTAGQCDCLVSDSNYFDADGVVNVSAVATNLISSDTADIQVEVLKIITDVSIKVAYADAISIGLEEKNMFPAEYPLRFSIFYTGGPVQTAYWMINCDIDGIFKDESQFINKTFPSKTEQKCSIFVELENTLYTAFINSTIELRESVLFTSMTSNDPVKQNETTIFTILLQKLAHQTCLWVDLGDNSSLLSFGDDSCPGKINVDQINPNILVKPRLKYDHKYPNTKEIVISHVYPRVGTYNVRMYASNEVSNAKYQMVVSVLAQECRHPNVTIKGIV